MVSHDYYSKKFSVAAQEENDLISVIVPVYNTGELLRNCIESILHQTYKQIEIIIVDDGSTDGRTVALCDELMTEHSNIRVIRQSNGGPSKARNTGIDNANGSYIGFVDSDDYIDSIAYQNLYHMATKYDVPLVLGAMQINGARQLSTGSNLEDGKHTQKKVLSKFMLGSWHSSCTNLYSKSLIEDIRFPQNEINEDYIFNFEVLLKSKEIAILNKPFYHYIKQEGSRTEVPASMKHADWLKHTEYVYKRVCEKFGEELINEASYQNLFANIILSNKCILNIADGFIGDPNKLYALTTKKLKEKRKEILNNPFLSTRLRSCAIALCCIPQLYKNIILGFLKLKK